MSESISSAQARNLILHSQWLNTRRSFGKGAASTLNAIEHLGYVQIDTLSVVARAHSHTLWNRVEGFDPADFNQLQVERKIYEHWAHALAYLPMRDYRFSLPMMERIADGQTHWYPKDSTETKKVIKRIRAEGPLGAKDFTDKRSSNAMWARSPSKRALEQLFMEGKLMISERVNFHKVYDLRERVLPDDVDLTTPTPKELCKHLILSFLRAHGIGHLKEFYYLRKGLGSTAALVIKELVEEGSVVQITVNGADDVPYYCTVAGLDFLYSGKANRALRILSPFDNSVIQRKRLSSLFDFDYQIECYVPQAKRRFGYFCLPILSGTDLVGRMDAKADRKQNKFTIMQLHIEKPIRRIESFYKKLYSETKRYASFCGCSEIELQEVLGTNIKPRWL